MSDLYKIVGQDNPGTTLTPLYTVPAGKQFVGTMWIGNIAAATKTYRIAVSPAGAGIANDHYVAYDATVSANDSIRFEMMALAPTDVVRVYGSDTNVTFNLMGVESSVPNADRNIPQWIDYLAARQSDETANANDDFFDDASIDAAWTTFTVSGAQTTSEKYGLFSALITTGQSAAQLNGTVKNISPTASADTYIETAIDVLAPNSNTANAGLIMTDGIVSGSNVAYVGFYALSGVAYAYQSHGTLGSYGSGGSTQTAIHAQYTRMPIHLRLYYSAANTFYGEWSLDGATWTDLGLTTYSKTITPTYIGFGWADNGSNNGIFNYHYFRYSP